jgi:hypothetical protein
MNFAPAPNDFVTDASLKPAKKLKPAGADIRRRVSTSSLFVIFTDDRTVMSDFNKCAVVMHKKARPNVVPKLCQLP